MVSFISTQQAAALVKDDTTLVVEGFLLNVLPDQTVAALESRFVTTGAPRNLTLVHVAGIGNGKKVGVNRLAHEGLLKRVIAGHYNLAPDIGRLIAENKIEGYNLPQGALAHMFRDIAANKAGTISGVGLHTFVDPRNEGGKMNERSKEDLIEVVTLGGQEQLFYKKFPIDICFLRGTYADEKGNISMEKEGVTVENFSIALATKNSGGIVVVQVGRVVKNGTLDPKLVKIPGILVDYVVPVPQEENMWEVSRDQAEIHSGSVRVAMDSLPPKRLDERKVIGRRAAMELSPDAVVNLGIGMPEMVSAVAAEEGLGERITLTVEGGVVGGIPVPVPLFGVAINPDCIIDQPYQFDLYDGGRLDIAYLGLAECDRAGNINVSKMNGRFAGCGGFIDITQNAKKVVFMGTFTAGGLKVAIHDGQLVIEQEGRVRKFLDQVGQITFSGGYSQQRHQPVTYVTERAVFQLRPDGLHLTEVAPGIDVERDILAHMDFMPIIDQPPKPMDLRLFQEAPMGLS